jgi:hypothetical protein
MENNLVPFLLKETDVVSCLEEYNGHELDDSYENNLNEVLVLKFDVKSIVLVPISQVK